MQSPMLKVLFFPVQLLSCIIAQLHKLNTNEQPASSLAFNKG